MSYSKQPANVIALSLSSFALLLSCILLGGCARQSGEKNRSTATPEHQPSQTASELSKQSSEAKPMVYENGATVAARFNGANMMQMIPPGGQMDLTKDYPTVYSGSITAILPDGTKVDANCPVKTLRTLRGYSDISAGKRAQEGLRVTFLANEQSSNPQQVVLLYNGQKWRVTDIVK